MRRVLPVVIVLALLFPTSFVLSEESQSAVFLTSSEALLKNLPFSEAVRVGNTVYLSGQIGVLPGTLSLVEGGIKEEAKQTMENIKATLEANNLSMRHIVKCTVMIADISKWSAFNDVYETYFEDNYPARSAFGVNGLAVGAQVEVECLAVDDS